MLTIQTEEHELFDSNKQEFLSIKPFIAKLEHSLISISKWESYYKKSFLPSRNSPGISSGAEELYYIECMSLNQLPVNGALILLQFYGDTIKDYIDDTKTATRITHIGADNNSILKTAVTSELVYSWMIEFNIPTEFQKWHFSRLLTLIDLCNVQRQKQAGVGKMNALESAQHRHQLNKLRRGRK